MSSFWDGGWIVLRCVLLIDNTGRAKCSATKLPYEFCELMSQVAPDKPFVESCRIFGEDFTIWETCHTSERVEQTDSQLMVNG
ncbi:hypothetical protein ASC66_11240 [Leifsonia sp. Root4]|nr:hypothetical protein ASC66_11240 [Leifsonia sp. Root4]